MAAVSGLVTEAGRPVTGIIVFFPQDGANYRDAVEGTITDGRYDLPSVPPGPKWIDVIVTRNGVSDPSLAVTAAPRTVDVVPGRQVVDLTLAKSSSR